MAKSVFALHFVSPRRAKDRPFTPKARISVRVFTQDTADGHPFIASETSFKELDGAVDSLIKDLKRVRKEARRRFEDHERELVKPSKPKSDARKRK
jgi:hypothetical protein